MQPLCQGLSLGTSWLLQLPREIRDLIYEQVLVQDVISIECAITESSSGPVSEAFKDLSRVYPLRAPRSHRRIWPMPAVDLDTNYGDIAKPTTIYMTYQITQQMERKSKIGANLDLLRVCRQIHAEALGIFYGSNVFSFTGDYRIPTAFAFLCDRPAASLLLIQSLELAFMEVPNTLGAPHANYPLIPPSTVSLVLRFAYHHFRELCTLLSTPRVQLRQLYLTVESMNTPEEGFLRETLDWETNSMNGQLDFLPLWFDPLLSIQGLKKVELCWISRRPLLQHMIYTASAIQRHMLSGEHNDAEAETTGQHCKAPSRFDMVHKIEELGVLDGVWHEKWLYEDLVLDVDGLRYANQGDIDKGRGLEHYEYRPHLERTLDLYTDVYVCCWKLERG
jgi:hypothetical protein